MDNLINIYLSAFLWLNNYLSGVINSFIQEPVTLPSGYWTDFIFLGFKDLSQWISFGVSVAVFVVVHVLIFKFFIWLWKFFGGVVRVGR